MSPTLGPASALDRCSELRRDAATLAALQQQENAQFFVMAGGLPVVAATPTKSSTRLIWAEHEAANALIAQGALALFLGRRRDVQPAPVFALAVADQTNGALVSWLEHQTAPPAIALDVRTLAAVGNLRTDDLAMAAQAVCLANWHRNTRCCGRCGGTTMSQDGGWRRRCWACGHGVFPRIDPAVIMLVTDGRRVVLAHEPRFPELMYSTLAGYVEPGDDIAHAVARETREEVGLEVTDVTFLASQPWPFPHQLMIGCVAHVSAGPIVCDPHEIVDARWFGRHELRHMRDRCHPDGLWIPGPASIAHALITEFLDGA